MESYYYCELKEQGQASECTENGPVAGSWEFRKEPSVSIKGNDIS
jgi:hypothetical protein